MQLSKALYALGGVMNKQEFIKKVIGLTVELKAQKSNLNSFGNYKYRNVEDITEAVKKLSGKYGLLLYTTAETKQIGDRFYQEITAVITDGENYLEAKSSARESLEKKGMDAAQITGGAITYARKYAISALLNIDDGEGQDPDTKDNSKQGLISEEDIEIISDLVSESIELGFTPKFHNDKKDVTKWTDEKARKIIGQLTVKIEDLKLNKLENTKLENTGA